MFGLIDEMRMNVVLDYLAHQACQRAANAGDLVHRRFASGFRFQCTLECFDLTADAAHPRDQPVFILYCMHNGPVA